MRSQWTLIKRDALLKRKEGGRVETDWKSIVETGWDFNNDESHLKHVQSADVQRYVSRYNITRPQSYNDYRSPVVKERLAA